MKRRILNGALSGSRFAIGPFTVPDAILDL